MAQEQKHSVAGQRFGALKKYMKANEQSASQLTGKVTEAGRQDLDTAATDRKKSQEEAFGSTYNTETGDKSGGIYGSEASRIDQATEEVGKVFDTDTKEIKLPEYQESKLSTGEGEKSGADIYKDYGQTEAQTYAYDPYALKKAEQQGKQIGTESGRFSLLKSRFGQNKEQPEYSRGQQRLDQLLLQSRGQDLKEAKTQLTSGVQTEKEAQSRFGNEVVDSFGGTRMVDGEAQNVKGSLENKAQALRDTIGGIDAAGQTADLRQQYLQKLSDDINPNLAGSGMAEKQALEERIRTNRLTEDDLTTLGVKDEYDQYADNDLGRWGLQTYGTDRNLIGQYTPEVGDLLSDEEKAKYQALADISGTENQLDVNKTSGVELAQLNKDFGDQWIKNRSAFVREVAEPIKKLDMYDTLQASHDEISRLSDKHWMDGQLSGMRGTPAAAALDGFLSNLGVDVSDRGGVKFFQDLGLNQAISGHGYVIPRVGLALLDQFTKSLKESQQTGSKWPGSLGNALNVYQDVYNQKEAVKSKFNVKGGPHPYNRMKIMKGMFVDYAGK